TTAILALLFVIAVTVFVGSEFRVFLGVYLFLLLASLLVFGFARVRRWQQYTEDYRAVAEALRVQLAWWDQGFVTAKDRVDRIYLFGAFGSLGLVRAAIQHLIDVALLENEPPKPSPGAEIGWIKSQISYFTQRVEERQFWVTLNDDLVWFFFIAAFGMVLAIVVEPGQPLHPHSPSWLAVLLGTLVPVGTFWLAHSFSKLARKQPHKSQRLLLKTLAFVTAGVTGVLLVLQVFYFVPSVVGAARFLASRGIPHLITACPSQSPSAIDCVSIISTKVVLMLATVIASTAGALRFYVETLAF